MKKVEFYKAMKENGHTYFQKAKGYEQEYENSRGEKFTICFEHQNGYWRLTEKSTGIGIGWGNTTRKLAEEDFVNQHLEKLTYETLERCNDLRKELAEHIKNQEDKNDSY